jgi:hypothetical protein
MKYLFVILVCTLFASCNQEELQIQNETYFIDLIKNQIEINDEMINKIFIRVKWSGRSSDKKIYQQILTIQMTREKALEQFFLNDFENIDTVAMKQYEMVLKRPFEEGVNRDSANYYSKLLSEDLDKIKYRGADLSKGQKVSWISQCLIVEDYFLTYYESQIDLDWNAVAKSYAFSDTNTQVGKPFEIFLSSIPSRLEGTTHNGEHYIIIPSFKFQIDGAETKIEYHIERIEDVGVLHFTPPKNGKYDILGCFYAQFDHDDTLLPLRKMTHSFEVK